VAVGEGQGLGNELSFGGPYLGFLAARREHLRRLPGRIAGVTSGARGERGFVLTLQTREQHIRREKATSNICTNQGLMMLRATIYLALLGKHGIVEVGRQCLAKCRYAAERIAQVPGYELRFKGPFVKEFVVECPVPARQVIASAAERGILAGVDLGWFREGMERSLLVAVTEKRSRQEIDDLVSALAEVSR
jgi:glycine dehydrogenase subunit 1